jgi:hypothetical protein
MKIRLVVPDVNVYPTDRPHRCRHCQELYLHPHGSVCKPACDHKLREAIACRYSAPPAGGLSTHYPPVHAQEPESRRTVVLAALMYALRLSCSAASHLLKVLGAEVSKTTV